MAIRHHATAQRLAVMDRVWTARWQELSDVCISRARSRVRPVDAAGMAAGLNALRGSGPTDYHVVGTGDYNGDGTSEVLFP